jgi:hypothetical protein
MKKVLFVLFTAAVFTACHSTTESELEATLAADSTCVDSCKAVDTIAPIVDTIKK